MLVSPKKSGFLTVDQEARFIGLEAIPNVYFSAKSKIRTSASFTPVSSSDFSAEMAAPSPSVSSVPLSLMLPRATCT